MISVIMPCRNEAKELLYKVVQNLVQDCVFGDMELIIVNDGSENSDGSFCPILRSDIPCVFPTEIINNRNQYGVGYCIDRGVEVSFGDFVVIAGSDTFPQRSWLKSLKNKVKSNQIGCCASVGLQPDNLDIDKPTNITRYGATLEWTTSKEDLPIDSEWREDDEYTSILDAKWAKKQSDEPYEIDCLLGAYYWMTKEFYQFIHGFDTEEGKRLRGHAFYGSLEAFLSLKAKIYGGSLRLYPDFRVGHVFGRIDDMTTVRAIRNDYGYWNKLFIAHTMLEAGLRDELLSFLKPNLPLGIAQHWIKQNWGYIQEIRQRNAREGKLISKT